MSRDESSRWDFVEVDDHESRFDRRVREARETAERAAKQAAAAAEKEREAHARWLETEAERRARVPDPLIAAGIAAQERAAARESTARDRELAARVERGRTSAPRTSRGKMIQVRDIKRKDRVLHGRPYPGSVMEGQNADIVPGVSIRLWGVTERFVGGNKVPRNYDITFRLGDRAIYGSYNFDYVGTITAIGPKTITVQHYESGSRVSKMALPDFNSYNWDYSAEEIAKRRANWSD